MPNPKFLWQYRIVLILNFYILPGNEVSFHIYILTCMCLSSCVWGLQCAMVCMGNTEENFSCFFPFYHEGSRKQTKVPRLRSEDLYSLSHVGGLPPR